MSRETLARAPPRRVILAAGGTGGHMFPAQALARELLGRGIEVALITDRRGGGFGPDLPQVETHRISAGALAGRGAFGKLKGALQLGLGVLQARRLLKSLRGDVVVGFGGYASVPTVLASQGLALRVVLHEQNAVLGRANRLLASRADAIATSFDKVDAIAEAARAKVRVTGNPVRPAIAALGRRPYAVPGETDRLRLLAIGGSQGATVFNEVIPAALCRLPEGLRRRIEISQQVRGAEPEAVAAVYRDCGIACDLKGFFDDMPERLAAAHLVIGRAGASTVAELAAAGRPGLMVPYPSATDDHQTANAQRLAEAGGGWVMPQSAFTAANLAERLESLLFHPALLARASRCARAYARDDAAAHLADMVCNLSGDNGDERRDPEEAAA
ncbi:MAG: undecaprenyldiphospho-muramoylpentapeptide beta-N-acetylglucosaminyltransferase [Proteobacteria bacterium]|nr:undecaprenyldiphospho-muramoylpentapeptide beta-N-acetylglucosaminyltransferase [Pseudomonadota bacterium]